MKHKIRNMIIILIILVVVLYFSLKDNFKEILSELININIWWFILALGIMLLYRFFMTLSLYNLIKCVKKDIKLNKVYFMILITQFFNAITPFATGGQPSQIYFLNKEGIKLETSTNIVVQNFIVYQIALILCGLVAILLNIVFDIFPDNIIVRNLIIIGFLINVLVMLLFFMLAFAKKFNTYIINRVIPILYKFKIIKDINKSRDKINERVNNFYEGVSNLKGHKSVLVKTIIYNIIGLIFFYIIPIVILYSMNEYTIINVVIAFSASAYVMIIGAFIPTPGASGGIEYGFINFFNTYISGPKLITLMLLWRIVTYYLGLIAGGVALVLYKRGDK